MDQHCHPHTSPVILSYPLQLIYIALDYYQAHTLSILILVQSHMHTHMGYIIRVGLRNSIPILPGYYYTLDSDYIECHHSHSGLGLEFPSPTTHDTLLPSIHHKNILQPTNPILYITPSLLPTHFKCKLHCITDTDCICKSLWVH